MKRYKDYNKYTSKVNYAPLLDFIFECGRLRHYKKGDYFVRIDERAKYIGYVVFGAFRFSCIRTDGTTRVVDYAFKNGFVGNYPSFLQNRPSTIDIQATRDSDIYLISKDEITEFYDTDAEKQFLRLKIAEVFLLEVFERLVSIYTMTPKEQYLEILNRCPELLDVMPLKELASYLMISPETLSRIRKNINIK